MRFLALFILTLFAANAVAERISCTTRMINVRTNKAPKVKICGAVTVARAFDNGIKYRKKPRFCNKFVVDFYSIKQGDKSRFTVYCKKIFTKNCYMVGIRDNASRMGMGQLSSHIVFSSIKSMPTIFNLNAGGVGHKRGWPGPGRLVRLDLSCRKSR